MGNGENLAQNTLEKWEFIDIGQPWFIYFAYAHDVRKLNLKSYNIYMLINAGNTSFKKKQKSNWNEQLFPRRKMDGWLESVQRFTFAYES